RKTKLNGFRIDHVVPKSFAEQLEGYCDVEMKREALRIVEAILAKKRLSPEELFQVICTVGIHSDFNRWEKQIRAAYDRQSRQFKRILRPQMLAMYASNKQWTTAAEFMKLRRPLSADEMFWAM